MGPVSRPNAISNFGPPAAMFLSLFQSPAHFGLLLTGKDGAVLDLRGLLTSDEPGKVGYDWGSICNVR